MTLVCEIARKFSRQSSLRAQTSQRTSHVISYINRHFRERCDYRELCRIVGMSRSSLRRYFLNHVGYSPNQYQFQLRVAEAASLLRSSDKSIEEIAAEVGFGDRNYFSRQFKKGTEYSPAEYRRLFAHKHVVITG